MTVAAALRSALGDIVDVTEAALEAARADRSGHSSPGRPVAVVHAFKTARHGRIVIGVDGSRGSRAAFEWAVDECRLRNATLHAVVAYEDQWGSLTGRIAHPDILVELEATVAHEAKRTLTTAVAAAPQAVVVTGETVRSNPARALLEKAADADLLVVGSRGHGGMASLLLGSVSRRCGHPADGRQAPEAKACRGSQGVP